MNMISLFFVVFLKHAFCTWYKSTMHSWAHILSLIMKDALGQMRETGLSCVDWYYITPAW